MKIAVLTDIHGNAPALKAALAEIDARNDIEHIYIMGGTNNALGNITAAAEYNFYVDPEAAKVYIAQ